MLGSEKSTPFPHDKAVRWVIQFFKKSFSSLCNVSLLNFPITMHNENDMAVRFIVYVDTFCKIHDLVKFTGKGKEIW